MNLIEEYQKGRINLHELHAKLTGNGAPSEAFKPSAHTPLGDEELEKVSAAGSHRISEIEDMADRRGVGDLYIAERSTGWAHEGTAGHDFMWGEGDGREMKGYSGHDYMLGSHVADTMDGGSGDDTLYGEGGDDVLKGGTGSDILYGGEGNDTFYGGKDGDNDAAVGGVGDDTYIWEPGGQDIFHGGEGNDTIELGVGNLAGALARGNYMIVYTAGDGQPVFVTPEMVEEGELRLPPNSTGVIMTLIDGQPTGASLCFSSVETIIA